jgi:hypothetical protein
MADEKNLCFSIQAQQAVLNDIRLEAEVQHKQHVIAAKLEENEQKQTKKSHKIKSLVEAGARTRNFETIL